MGLIDNVNVRVGGQNILDVPFSYTTVVLKPNMIDNINVLEQLLISLPRTKYVVKWNYDLQGLTITLPDNCLIEFDGGSFSNGTLIGNDTIIISYQDNSLIFKDVNLEGTFTYTRYDLEKVEATLNQLQEVIENKLDLSISYEPLVVTNELKLIQENKIVTISNGNGNSVSFNAIILTVEDYQVYVITIRDLDGGSINDENFKFTDGYYRARVIEGHTLILPTPIKQEYNFLGWYENADGTGDKYDAGDEITPEHHLNLYAKWVKVNYKVELRGLEGGNLEYWYPSGSVISFDNPTKVGYTFKYWQSGGTFYQSISDYTVTHNVVFEAQWNINKYTVTFHSNYPDGTTNTTQTYLYNYNTPISDVLEFRSEFVCGGYNLDTWNVSLDGTGSNPNRITENIDLYAQWSLLNQYYLTISIPTSIPNWSNSILNTISFGLLEGWSDWEGLENLYLVLPSEEGKTDISDYIDVTENNFGTSLLDGFEEIESSVQGIIVLQWNGFSPIEDSEHTFLTFK